MGWFGNIVSKCKEAYHKAKDYAVEKFNQAKDWVKDKAPKLYNKFTGRDKYEEAEELYNRITERYNSRRRRFEDDVIKYSNQIEKKVEAINGYKERIKKELFPEMVSKLSKLYDFDLTGKFNIDEFNIGGYSFDSVRTKEQLYKIDFKKHPFKTNLQAVLTLGFYTRKKTKETLCAVQEEEGKINYEIEKMEIETKRLETIDCSLENIEKYFASMTETYKNLLIRVDNSINFLFVRCMTFARKIVRQEMSVRYLSKMQIKEIEAVITASKILKQMAETQILSIDNDKEVEKYEKVMKEGNDAVVVQYEAA